MTFTEYARRFRHGDVKAFAEKVGITVQTINKAIDGEHIGLYATAERISEGTDGVVSIEELCRPDRFKRRRQNASKKRPARRKKG